MNTQRARPQIRVLIVDDSAFMRNALTRMIASDPDLWVAGTARDGNDALRQIPGLDPDVITLDVEMPGWNGLETLRHIMAEYPRPVIMVSSVTVDNAETTFNALAAGAFDYVPKQLAAGSLDIVHLRDDLIAKVKAAAQSRVGSPFHSLSRKPPRPVEPIRRDDSFPVPEIVALGTSTGGPKALQEILPALPPDLSVPIVIVQHMPVGFTGPFARRLDDLCAVSIREAAHQDVIQPGVVYIAPAGIQFTVEGTKSRAQISLSERPEHQLHVPSVDVMMQSVAEIFRSRAMGVIMTGMGADGAQGMKEIHGAGGFTIGQDEASCAVYGMPRVCAEMGILNRVVPLAQIPTEIVQATKPRKAHVV